MAKYMRRKYVCKLNDVVEVSQYVVGDNTEGSPKWKRSKKQTDKRDENARQAIRVLARILNCNYTTQDYLVELTYSDEAHERLFDGLDPDETWTRAKEIVGGKLDAVRKEAKKTGCAIKTVAVTADMDGETGEMVRIHHHVVITTDALPILKKKWKHGLVLNKNLYRQGDYTPLAAYLLNQVRHMENRKKYSCSRNMTEPEVYEEVLDELPKNEIKVQPGAKVLDRTSYKEGYASQYVRYKRRPKTPKRGGRKQGSSSPKSCENKGGSELC